MAGRIPFPSLPIIKIPFPDKVFSYKFLRQGRCRIKVWLGLIGPVRTFPDRCNVFYVGERTHSGLYGFGLKTSAVSLLHTIWEIPNQSANRMIVPKLPGSWIPSNARTSSFSGVISVISQLGRLKIASTSWDFSEAGFTNIIFFRYQ